MNVDVSYMRKYITKDGVIDLYFVSFLYFTWNIILTLNGPSVKIA